MARPAAPKEDNRQEMVADAPLPASRPNGRLSSIKHSDLPFGNSRRYRPSDETTNDSCDWAKISLPLKNTLLEADARILEAAYQKRFEEAALPDLDIAVHEAIPAVEVPPPEEHPLEIGEIHAPAHVSPGAQVGLAFPKEPPRRGSKDHLAFMRSQACLICQKTPADAHHLKFAQPRALGRKVSDEFTVPLCRSHHLSLHRQGDERAWWANLQISPFRLPRNFGMRVPSIQRTEHQLLHRRRIRCRRREVNEWSCQPSPIAVGKPLAASVRGALSAASAPAGREHSRPRTPVPYSPCRSSQFA